MQNKFTNLRWVFDDRYRIILHILFWAYLYLYDVLAIFGILEPDMYDWIFFTILAADIFIVYFNLYVLIPQFLLKKKYFTYLFLTLFTVFLNSLISLWLSYPWEEIGIDKELPVPYIGFLFGPFDATLQMVVLAIAIKLLKLFAKNQLTISSLETSNLKSELTFLKNQINPHFLFNALNNIYVQTRKHPKEAPESVLLLSELLRYQLYDCAKEKVYLHNELEYIKNYIALEKMRRSNAVINLEIIGSPNGKMVAPFLFIPFLENAVKHGLETQKEAFINIKFDISDHQLDFFIANPKSDNPNSKKEGGIGLVNIKRRLALLYPNQYELTILNSSDIFEVNLVLKINTQYL